jgi:hypothetical protein
MAIDLMVMPLSRYFTGDFVTPAMQDSWDKGIPYGIVIPGQPVKECPPGVPFGGPDAPQKRLAALPQLADNLRHLPQGIAEHLWDEASATAPRFHRFHPLDSLTALQEEAASALEPKPAILKRLSGKHQRSTHLLHATLYLPVAFPDLFITADIVTGSVYTLRSELEEVSWSPATASALATYRAAIADAIELRLPIHVDM